MVPSTMQSFRDIRCCFLLTLAAPQAARDQVPLILALGQICPGSHPPRTHAPTHPRTQSHQCPSKRKVQSRNGAPPFLPFWMHAAGDGEPDLHNRATGPLTLVALLPQITTVDHIHFAASTSSTEDILSEIFVARTALICR